MSLVPPKSIELERLLLLPLRREHAGLVFHTYASKPEVTRYLLWPTHESVEQTERFLRLCETGWRARTIFNYGIWLKPYDRLAGSIGLHKADDGSYQIGYALSPSSWGKGYATDAAKGLVKVVLSLDPKVDMTSMVHPEHKASARVLEKAGFIPDPIENRCHVFPSLESGEVRVNFYRYAGH